MIYLLILLIIISFSLKYDFQGFFLKRAKKPYMFLCICFILLAGLRFFVVRKSSKKRFYQCKTSDNSYVKR